MRNYSLLILIFVCLFISCSKSPEDKIKKEFFEFAKINFDDPKTIEEVTSVKFTDSVSTADFKILAQEYIQLQSQYNQLIDSLTNIYMTWIHEHPGQLVKYKNSYIAQNALLEDMNTLSLIADAVSEGKLIHYDEIPESILNFPDTTIYIYEIKYRLSTPDGKLVKTIYADTDKDLNKIEINYYNNIEDPEIKDFANEIEDFRINMGKWFEIYKLRTENNQTLANFISDIINNK